MGLAPHIDVPAQVDVWGVLGVQRLNLCVGSFGEIEDVVTLDGLV